MKSLLVLTAALVLAVSACSNTVDITGTWNYSASLHDTLPVLNCVTSGGTMQLVESNSLVTGTYSGLAFNCTGAVNGSFGPYSGDILNGFITGGMMNFSFDLSVCCASSDSWGNTGLTSNATMNGSLTSALTLNGTQYPMFGTWVAHKQ